MTDPPPSPLPPLDAVVARLTASDAFRAAEATPQDPRHHPEGNVGRHLRLVLDAALALADANGLTDGERLVLAVVALAHDLGKTEAHHRSGGAAVHGHEAISGRLLVGMLPELGLPADLTETALDIVLLHDRGVAMRGSRPGPGPNAFRRLAERLDDLRLYAIFTIADRLGANGDLTIPIWLIGELRQAGAPIPPIRLPDGGVV